MSFNSSLIIADLLLVLLMTLFLFVAWRTNPEFPGIREWFLGFASGSMNIVVFVTEPFPFRWMTITCLEVLLMATGVFGLIGCRKYVGREIRDYRLLAAMVIAVVSISAFWYQTEQNQFIGFVLASLLTGGLCLIGGSAMWHGDLSRHPVRHMFAFAVLFHGIFMLLRPWLFNSTVSNWIEQTLGISGLDVILFEQILIAPLLSVGILLLINEDSARLLRVSAEYDSLTQLRNRGSFFVSLQKAASLSVRLKSPLSILLIDLDHFKIVNDQHGHQAGDKVLQSFAQVAQACLRNEDEIGRIGGEEFAIFLVNTPVELAQGVAERLLKSIQETPIHLGNDVIHYSASIGIAGYEEDLGIDKTLVLADQALYRAKQLGRGRVEVAEPTQLNETMVGRAGLEPATKGL